MRILTFLFASLMTISMMKVGEAVRLYPRNENALLRSPSPHTSEPLTPRSVDPDESDDPDGFFNPEALRRVLSTLYPHTPSPHTSEPDSPDDRQAHHTGTRLFDPAVIRSILGTPIDPNIEFYDVFLKILIDLKEKDLTHANALGFAESMCIVEGRHTPYFPYLRIFTSIVKFLKQLEENPETTEEKLRLIVTDSLFQFFLTDCDVNQIENVTSTKISPSVMKLYRREGDNVESAAREVATVVLRDAEVREKIGKIFHGDSPVFSPAYFIVLGAVQSAEQSQ